MATTQPNLMFGLMESLFGRFGQQEVRLFLPSFFFQRKQEKSFNQSNKKKMKKI
jgi:hypothetical protein